MLKIPCKCTMMIVVCKIVKYGTKMEIKNLTTTTNITYRLQYTVSQPRREDGRTRNNQGDTEIKFLDDMCKLYFLGQDLMR